VTDQIPCETGVRHGCNLSSLFFTMTSGYGASWQKLNWGTERWFANVNFHLL